MRVLSSRKHLAHQILVNVHWYNQQAKQHHQGTLSQTWIKYVAKLASSQWDALKRGSNTLPLSTYQRTFHLIHDMETTVLGKTESTGTNSESKHDPDSMLKAKRNLKKVLANVNQNKKSATKDKPNSSMNRAKQNLRNLLGSTTKANPTAQRVITSIKTQRRKNRFNVYVDGRYAFPAGINELSRYHLYIGMPVSKRLENVISRSSDVSKMFTKASARIVHHLRTEREIRIWLKKKYDCSSNNADQVIQKLKDYHLINDQHYAHEYIRAEIISGSKGPMAITRHLRSKGVRTLTIQTTMEQFYPVSKQLSVAEHLAKDKFRIKGNTPFTKRLRKIKLSLVRKGFSFDVASQATNNCHFQPDASQQGRLLHRYTRQAFRRYGRQMTAQNRYQIHMKIKRFLFRKGFGFDDIDQAIEEHETN